MSSVEISQALWPYVAAPLAVAYVWWAAVWLTVAYYYLRSAAREHSARHPGAVRLGFLLFADAVWRMATQGLVQLFRGRFLHNVPPTEHRYPSGMVLQFGIVCSALCSALFGLTLFNADRSGFGIITLAMTASAVMLSTVGGMIHLYPALRHRIALWRTGMLFSWLGVSCLYSVGLLRALA